MILCGCWGNIALRGCTTCGFSFLFCKKSSQQEGAGAAMSMHVLRQQWSLFAHRGHSHVTISLFTHRAREWRLLCVAACWRPAVLGPRSNVGLPRLEGCLYRLTPLHPCLEELLIAYGKAEGGACQARLVDAQGRVRAGV